MAKSQSNKIITIAFWVILLLISSCTPKDIFCDEAISVLPYYRTTNCDGEVGEDLRTCAARELLSDLYDELKYPTEALEEHIEGDVVVKFDVDKSGVTLNHEVTMSLGFGCDEEAVRVIKTFEFFPAQNNCNNIAISTTSTMSLYVRFRL